MEVLVKEDSYVRRWGQIAGLNIKTIVQCLYIGMYTLAISSRI
jgi:hypothetical protein